MSSALLVAVSPMSRNYDLSEKLLKDGKKLPYLSSRDHDASSNGKRLVWHRSPSLTKVAMKELALERHSSVYTSRPRRSSSLEAPRVRQGPTKQNAKTSEASIPSMGSESSGEEERVSRDEPRVKRLSLSSRSQHSLEDLKQAIDSRRPKASTQRPRRSSSLEVPRSLRGATEQRNHKLDLSLPSEGGESDLDHINKLLSNQPTSLMRQCSLDDVLRLSGIRKSSRSPPNSHSTLKDFKLEMEKLRGARSSLGRQRVREDPKPQTETGKARVAAQSPRPPRYNSAEDLQRDSGHESLSSFESKGLGSSFHESGSSFESDKSQRRHHGLLSLSTKQQLWDELKPIAMKQTDADKPRKELLPVATLTSTKTVLERVLEAGRMQGNDTGKEKKGIILEREDSTGSLTLDDLGLEGTWKSNTGYPSADSSRNTGKIGSMATSSFLASNVLGGSRRQHSLPMLESVASFGDSMTSNASQLSILREGRFSKSRLHNSRSSFVSTLSESQKAVCFASTVTIINETAPGRLMITRRPLPQGGPAIKMDTAYGHQPPRLFTTHPSSEKRTTTSPPPLQPKSESQESEGARRQNRARRNSLELVRAPTAPQIMSQERLVADQQQQQLTAVKQARQAKANAAFASLGDMLQPR